jgi:ferredoxin-NADP reductase
MKLTEDIQRESVLEWATVTTLNKLSSTVVGLSLTVDNPVDEGEDVFKFKAGQWVDFHISPQIPVGGYSITSIPSQLPVLELAVKTSKHPPAKWVCEEATIGARVQVRVGGEFCYAEPESTSSTRRLLFIAGGVGINPLYGMLRQLHHDQKQGTKAVLMYSASTADELVFREELDAMASESLRVIYTTTKDDGIENRGRISHALLDEALGHLECDSPDAVYVCGPPGMAEDMLKTCTSKGVPKDRIQFESWW